MRRQSSLPIYLLGVCARYVGESHRHLRTRVPEHRQLSRTSVVLDHILSCNSHSSSLTLNEFKIIAKGLPSKQRIIREAIEIKSSSNLLNILNRAVALSALSLRLF